MSDIAPEDSRCFHCAKEVRLSHDERVAKKFRCPACHAISPAMLGAEAQCERCAKVLTLDDLERQYGRFRCPYCKHETVLAGARPIPASDILPGEGLVGPVPSLHDAKKDIVHGSLWLVAGVGLTAGSILTGFGFLLVCMGPVVYGLIRLIRGLAAGR